MPSQQIRMPYGLRILRILSVISLFLYVAVYYGIRLIESLLTFLPDIFSLNNIIVGIIPVILSVVVIFAINLRNRQLHTLAVFLFVAVIAIFLLPLLHFSWDNLVFTVLTDVPFIFFFWYWLNLKTYFTNQNLNSYDAVIIKADKKVNLFLIIWILAIVIYIGNVIVLSRINSTAQKIEAARHSQAFSGKSYKEKKEYCFTFEGTHKDLCLYLAYYSTKNKDNITVDDCNLMFQENYKMVCYGMINRCDVLTNLKLRKACEYTAQTTSNLAQ